MKRQSFDGESRNFHMWWKKFKAYASVNRFSASLKIGGEADLPHKEDEILDESRQEQKAKSETSEGINSQWLIWLWLLQPEGYYIQCCDNRVSGGGGLT